MSQKIPAQKVFDVFSGSTRVSQAYAKSGYTVIANDTAIYSKIFNTAYLLNIKEPKFYQELIDHLNSLNRLKGGLRKIMVGTEAIKIRILLMD